MLKTVAQKPATRKFIATTMIATSVAVADVNNLNAKDTLNTSIQTEVISKAGAEALKSNAYTLEVTNPERNKNLEKLYIKSCENGKSVKEKKKSLDAIYRVFGTYGATIEVQRQIDDAYLAKAFNSYTGHYVLTDSARNDADQKIEDFNQWKNDIFYTELFKSELEMYEEEPFPSAEKAISVIDNHINNPNFFSEADVEFYNNESEVFKSLQTESESVQAKSDLLAYKVHLLNSLAFSKYIKDKPFPEYSILSYYFSYEFVNGGSSIKPQ